MVVLGIKVEKHREGFPPRLACCGWQNGFFSKADCAMSVLSRLSDADCAKGKIPLSYRVRLQSVFAARLQWAGGGGKDTGFGWQQTQGRHSPAFGA